MTAIVSQPKSIVPNVFDQRWLRVLQVTEASCAGVGGHVLDLVEGLPEENCEVHLLYSPARMDVPFQQRVENNKTAKFFALDFRRAPQLKDIYFAKKLNGYIKKHGPFDIVHAHSTKAGGLTRIPFVGRNSKNVYTPNGIFTMNPTLGSVSYFIARRIELALARRSQAIVAVSPEEKQHMLEIGMPASKVKFIANGIRQQSWNDRTTVRRELGIDQNAIVVGFLGRFANQKNPRLLIEAFARLECPSNVRLAMVGNGQLETECRKLATDLGIDSRIDWLGFKTAAQSMPAFDLFVMPSQYEGMPYVMMEAMSIGLPIVATDVGGTSIGIEQGTNGFVVPRGDCDKLAIALQKLVDSKPLRQSFGAASKRRAEMFSVDTMVQKTRELYDMLVHGKNKDQ